MRTFDRATFQAAQKSWAGFGWQWQEVRRIAASRGFLYAPNGSPDDDRDADQPSQRSIVWRALQDNPKATAAIVSRSSSWSQVVDRIIGLEERLRADADETQRDDEWSRRGDLTHRDAAMSLRQIMERIGNS